MVLETFYMVSKINSVKKEYNKINDMYNNNESSILLKIRNDALANNFDIMVENEDYMLNLGQKLMKNEIDNVQWIKKNIITDNIEEKADLVI